MEKPEFSITVYKDHAIIMGFLTADILSVLIELCEKTGFTHMIFIENGFKLVRKGSLMEWNKVEDKLPISPKDE